MVAVALRDRLSERVCRSQGPAQVAAFLEHIYGPEDAAEEIAALRPEAMYEFEADDI